MRYRALTSDTGDMQFGQGSAEWLVNSPDAVVQAVRTRLGLIRGEYFLDTTAGTPWPTEILGVRTASTYDRALRNVILGTQGVKEILSYSSALVGRALHVNALVDTIYGQAALNFGLGTAGSGTPAGPAAEDGVLDFSIPGNPLMGR